MHTLKRIFSFILSTRFLFIWLLFVVVVKMQIILVCSLLNCGHLACVSRLLSVWRIWRIWSDGIAQLVNKTGEAERCFIITYDISNLFIKFYQYFVQTP